MVRFHPAVLLATILLVGVTILLASQKTDKKWQQIFLQ